MYFVGNTYKMSRSAPQEKEYFSLFKICPMCLYRLFDFDFNGAQGSQSTVLPGIS